MRILFAIGIAAAGLGVADCASAADLPVKAPPAPTYNWAGWHAGLNIGYGFGPHREGTLSGFSTAFGLPAAVAAGFVPANLGLSPSGVLGGIQGGYDWTRPWGLVGVEADFQGSGIVGNSVVGFPGGGGFVPSTTTSRDALDWFGTVRARLGTLVTPRTLLYATGGFAYGGVRDNFAVVGTPPTAGDVAGSDRVVRAGWAAGAGAEYAATDHISIRAEYLHVDLGTDTVRGYDVSGFFPGVFIDYGIPIREDIVRVAVDYKF